MLTNTYHERSCRKQFGYFRTRDSKIVKIVVGSRPYPDTIAERLLRILWCIDSTVDSSSIHHSAALRIQGGHKGRRRSTCAIVSWELEIVSPRGDEEDQNSHQLLFSLERRGRSCEQRLVARFDSGQAGRVDRRETLHIWEPVRRIVVALLIRSKLLGWARASKCSISLLMRPRSERITVQKRLTDGKAISSYQSIDSMCLICPITLVTSRCSEQSRTP